MVSVHLLINQSYIYNIRRDTYCLGVCICHKLYRCLALLYKKDTLSGKEELNAAYLKINLKNTMSETYQDIVKTIVGVDEDEHSFKLGGNHQRSMNDWTIMKMK